MKEKLLNTISNEILSQYGDDEIVNVESNAGSVWFTTRGGKSYYVSIGECGE